MMAVVGRWFRRCWRLLRDAEAAVFRLLRNPLLWVLLAASLLWISRGAKVNHWF